MVGGDTAPNQPPGTCWLELTIVSGDGFDTCFLLDVLNYPPERRGRGSGRRREFGARNGHALAVVIMRESAAKSLREAGYGDDEPKSSVVAGPW